jgi:hypothetical protein
MSFTPSFIDLSTFVDPSPGGVRRTYQTRTSPLDQAQTTEQLARLGAAADEPARLRRGHRNVTPQRCTCRECHPAGQAACWYTEDAAKAFMSVDIQLGEPLTSGVSRS